MGTIDDHRIVVVVDGIGTVSVIVGVFAISLFSLDFVYTRLHIVCYVARTNVFSKNSIHRFVCFCLDRSNGTAVGTKGNTTREDLSRILLSSND